MKEEIKSKAERIFYAISENDKMYQKWCESKSNIEKAYKNMENYLNYEVENISSVFRPMVAEDVQVGQIVFGRGDYGWYCHVIDEVYDPNDKWKAYCADDGCRYGLYESYIFIE